MKGRQHKHRFYHPRENTHWVKNPVTGERRRAGALISWLARGVPGTPVASRSKLGFRYMWHPVSGSLIAASKVKAKVKKRG